MVEVAVVVTVSPVVLAACSLHGALSTPPRAAHSVDYSAWCADGGADGYYSCVDGVPIANCPNPCVHGSYVARLTWAM